MGPYYILLHYLLLVDSGWEVTYVLTGEFHKAPMDSLKLIIKQLFELSESQDKVKDLNLRKLFARKEMNKESKQQHI